MIGIAILFIILGVVVKYGKMYSLIAGYNTLPSSKKARYDIDAIATVFKNAMFGMALIIILGYFTADVLDDPDIEIISLFGSLLIGVPYLLLKANSDKFKIDKNPDRQNTE